MSQYHKELLESEETKVMTDGSYIYDHVGYNQYQRRHVKMIHGKQIGCIHIPIGGRGLKPYKNIITEDEGNWYESDVDRMADQREKTGFY